MNDHAQPATAPVNPPFVVRRIYLKDCSLEIPKGPMIFQQQWKPRVEQELQTTSTKIADYTYDVVLTVTVTAKLLVGETEEIAFIVEVHQAGIFHINLENEEATRHQINVICPSILFPYAREAVDALAVKGSFPALMLPPINFQGLYQQALAQQQAKASTPAH